MTERTDEPPNCGPVSSGTSRRRFLTGVAAGVTASTGVSGAASAQETDESDRFMPRGATVGIETIAAKPSLPTDFAVPPGTDDRRFLVGRLGRVYVHDSGGVREEPFIDVSDRMAEIEGEMGLLGMAFHPDFRRNGKFYLHYSAPRREGTPANYSHTEVLAEFAASADRTTGLPGSERALLEIPSPQSTHNAGAVVFGPDGYLYMGMGDGGGTGDAGLGHVSDWYGANAGGNGQDVTENLLGSVLRIDVDAREDEKPYAVPDDNPLVGKPGLDEHYAWGFRNPWRMSFNDGRLFVADVGQGHREEVNIVEKGGNYGWNVKEGTTCFSTDSDEQSACPDRTPPDVRGGEPLLDPVIEYPHTYNEELVGISVIGGYVFENDAIPALRGKYVFGDYTRTGGPDGSLFAATPDEGQWSLEELVVEGSDNGRVNAYVIAFGRDNAGDLYVLTTGGTVGGTVHRIVPPSDKTVTEAGTETATKTETATETETATKTETVTKTETTTGGPITETDATMTETAGENTTTVSGGTARSATTGDGTADSGTDRAGIPETETDETGDSVTETTGTSGPGFGVLAALGGLASVVAYLLSDDE